MWGEKVGILREKRSSFAEKVLSFEGEKQLASAYGLTGLTGYGYGAQGGGAKDVAPAFDKAGRGAVINSSRGIMCAYKKGDYAETDYAKAAREEAIRMRDEINSVL